ncbi:MAG: sulfatase-like hydrolase/transferase [Sandaracinaceae bacterium]|nr:sulfatase-like hydrolase/transferase [Sandaracinaceae bacterium]
MHNETQPESSIAHAATRGLFVGAGAGAIVAWADFGALWLWLSHWTDRGALFMRTMLTLVPLGALVTALLFAVGAWALRSRQFSSARMWPVPLVALASPACLAVGHMLFTGGKMSRLPARWVLALVAGLALVFGVYLSIRIARALFETTRGRGVRVQLVLGAIFFTAAFAVSKIDQRFLPNLYDYLHGVLGVKAFVCAACAICFFARTRASLVALLPTRTVTRMLAFALATLGLVANLLSLDSNPNVRVALFDPRAAVTRSVMLGIEPLVIATQPAPRTRRHNLAAQSDPIRAEIAALTDLPQSPNANVLMISIDALRADHLGAYGYARGVSPFLDRLARNSVVFEQVYSAAPHSSYSLSSIMSSEFLHETLDLGQALPTETLSSVLADAGYHTAGFYTLGIFHTEGERLLPYRENAFGFAVHDHAERDAEQTATRVLEEVQRLATHNESPAFLWAHFFDCHEPYEDTSLGTRDVDRYDGELRKTDRAIQRLVTETRRILGEDLVIVVTSDHGEEFHDHGGVYHGSTLFEEQIRVPLILHAPSLRAGRVAAPVQSIDIAPTILGVVGVAPADSMRGRDLRSVATGRMRSLGPAFAAVLQKRMIVDWPYKLIADLRFNTYSLFNLERDPHERQNLASAEPARMTALRGGIYDWLDRVAVPLGSSERIDPRELALQRGRLTDRRAVPALGDLLLDRTASIAMRREAAQILTRLADESSAPKLVQAMEEPEPLVAAEAAIALGRMYDSRAREKLRALVLGEDPDIRTRAGISLGRLRDSHAVPALIEAIGRAETAYDREEAVRWLGRLRDPRAVESLLALIPEFRTRHLVAIALGEIGDPRAFTPLVDMLGWEHRTNIRDCVVRGMGRLGDSRALPILTAITATEPDMSSAPESLIRLGALDRGVVGGADILREAPGLAGFGRCVAGPLIHDWDYAQRTFCETNGPVATVRLAVPASVATANAATFILNVRRSDAPAPATLQVRVGNLTLQPVSVDGQWTDRRWSLSAQQIAALRNGVTARFVVQPPEARIWLDHALLVPQSAEP